MLGGENPRYLVVVRDPAQQLRSAVLGNRPLLRRKLAQAGYGGAERTLDEFPDGHLPGAGTWRVGPHRIYDNLRGRPGLVHTLHDGPRLAGITLAMPPPPRPAAAPAGTADRR